MTGLLLAAALLQAEPPACNAVPPPANRPPDCTQWRLLRETPYGNSYVRPQALARNGDRVEIENRIVFREAARNGARSLHGRIHLDCRQRTVLMGNGTAFDANGAPIQDLPMPESEQPETVETGTAYGDMIAIFCPGGQGERR